MSAFGRYHPLVTGIYFFAVLIVTTFVNNPIIQLLSLTGGICFSFIIGRRKGFLICIITFCLITITNPLFSHNGVTPLFFLNGNPFTLEAVIYGIVLAGTVVSVIIWFGCLSDIMSSDKIMYLFGRIVPKLALIISMSLRFVPLFTRQAKKIWRSQKAFIDKDEGIIGKVKSGLKVFSSVTVWAFENAIDTSASMKARGYGDAKRTSFNLFKFGIRDGIVISVIFALLAVCITGIIMGHTEFDYYPAISEFRLSFETVCVYVSFGALAFLPFIIEVKEAFAWKYCVSRI